MKFTRALVLSVLAFLSAPSHSFIITSFPSTVYSSDTNAMNASLGIDETYVIEDFEDNTLIAGLTVSDYTDGIGSPTFVSNAVIVWDGGRGFVSGLAQPIQDPTFSFADEIMRFGIGISDYQPEFYGVSEILVNGFSVGSIPVSGTLRDGYIFITAGEGESINTVTFLQAGNDSILYDHLAAKMGKAPIPSTLVLIGLGLAGLGCRRFKGNKAA